MKKYLIVLFLSLVSFTVYILLISNKNHEKTPNEKSLEIAVEDLSSTPYSSKMEKDEKETNMSNAIKNPFVTNNKSLLKDDSKQQIYKETDYQSTTSNLGDSSVEIDLEENFSMDMNGNEVATPFIPASNGVENEYGEGVAKEFEPEIMVFNSKVTSELEENYIASLEGDIANPIMLEDSSNENEAASLMLEETSIDDEYGEGVAREFQPAIIPLNTNFIPELEDNDSSSNEGDLANPILSEEKSNGDEDSVLVFE